MGVLLSTPHFDGPVSVLPLSSVISSTPYSFAPAASISTRISNDDNTETVPVVSVPISRTDRAPPADVTDSVLIDVTTSPEPTRTTTAYLSTVTVTNTIKSTHLVTATATVSERSCPTTKDSNKIQPVSLTKVHTTSTAGTLKHSSLPSHHGISLSSGQSENRVQTARITGSTRLGSISQSERESLLGTGPNNAKSESEHTFFPYSKPVEITTLARVIATRTSTMPRQMNSKATTTLTKVQHVTTTTIYATKIANRTTTYTITAFPANCSPTRTSTSRPSSPTNCTSATPNPKPPANDTCAEDGLLEYSNTPQPPDTLEGCATACLADGSCLSFTFIPSRSTCFTSLYPLADSAFAGVQDYRIYNYDRGCYSCSL